MLSIIVGLLAAFAWSASRRFRLLQVGGPVERFDSMGDRLKRTLGVWLGQNKMHQYPAAGLAHNLVFLGFLVLLLNTLILWGRGFDPGFGLFVLGVGQPLGTVYNLLKDVFALAVIAGVAYFFYVRLVVKPARITQSNEAFLILGIIWTMMFADIFYNGAAMVLHQKYFTYGALDNELRGTVDKLVLHRAREARTGQIHFEALEPGGSAAAMLLAGLSPKALVLVAQIGFWTHSSLVLIFLNILPYSKHFHILTSFPNVLFSDLTPPGRLRPIAERTKNAETGEDKPMTEVIMERLDTVTSAEDTIGGEGFGAGRVEHYSWKDVLDFYTCTECGRCSDNCPANLTGKLLSPKQLTLDLRNYLYENEGPILDLEKGPRSAMMHGPAAASEGAETAAEGEEKKPAAAEAPKAYVSKDLVVPSEPATGLIHPDVIWACTTCRACEQQCPVLISYVDKIVDMRRNVVMVRGEFPHELQRPFQGLETNGNPWNLSRLDRAAWSEGLDVKTLAEHGEAEVLYWVGCAASYDDRAKKIARATAKLLAAAKVDFAILGQEECCTGDPARRAGNEFLFATLAEQNVAVFEQYGVAKKKVITTCPHCFNSLLNEYADFGAKLEVVHHTDYLLGLLKEGKLKVKKQLAEKLVYHDSCYLGRYNEIYDAPREILTAIGSKLVEAEWSREKGLCCGAGGAQMWMEEKGTDRVNKKRTLQLLDTGAKSIATACPFCMTMITDGLKAENKEESIQQLDVAELLLKACALEDAPKTDDGPKEEAAE